MNGVLTLKRNGLLYFLKNTFSLFCMNFIFFFYFCFVENTNFFAYQINHFHCKMTYGYFTEFPYLWYRVDIHSMQIMSESNSLNEKPRDHYHARWVSSSFNRHPHMTSIFNGNFCNASHIKIINYLLFFIWGR